MSSFFKDNPRYSIPFLRLMVCVLFFPFLILMDRNLTNQVYYLAGFTFIYAALLYLFPRINHLLKALFPFQLAIDLALISLLIFFVEKYLAALFMFYLLPVIALSFNPKPLPAFLGAFLASSSYLAIAVTRGWFLQPAIVQVVVLFIIAFFTRFLVQYIHQTYFQQANLDSLTKIHNRRFFNHILGKLVANGTSFSLILIDLDNFKRLNDTEGHHHGDYVLKVVASTLREYARAHDIVSRYGGDEFVILLPDTSKETSRNIAEKIRKSVLVNPRLLSYTYIGLSIGIAAYPEDALTPEEILQKADEALYKSKNMGKNCVYVYH